MQFLVTHWQVKPHVVLMGASAGVPKIWNVAAVVEGEHCEWIKFVVSISGAWHPILLPLFRDKIMKLSSAMCIVQHHEKDSLCPWWPKLDEFWTDLNKHPDFSDRVFMNIEKADPHAFCGHPHDIGEALLRIRMFWKVLATEPQCHHRELIDVMVDHNFAKQKNIRHDELFAQDEIEIVQFDAASSLAAAALFTCAIAEAKLLMPDIIRDKIRGLEFHCAGYLKFSRPMTTQQCWPHLIAKCMRSLHSTSQQRLLGAITTGTSEKDCLQTMPPHLLTGKGIDAMLHVGKIREPLFFGCSGLSTEREIHIRKISTLCDMAVVAITFPNEVGSHLKLSWCNFPWHSEKDCTDNYFYPWATRYLGCTPEPEQRSASSHLMFTEGDVAEYEGVSANDVLMIGVLIGNTLYEFSLGVDSDKHWEKTKETPNRTLSSIRPFHYRQVPHV